jgi:hypothetical protein
MVHAQKPDFIFRRNGPSPFKSAGASVQSTTGSRGVRISGSNDGYTMFRGSVKSTGYPLHSPVSPSLPVPCVIVSEHISTGLYDTTISLLSLCSSSTLCSTVKLPSFQTACRSHPNTSVTTHSSPR